MITNFVFYLLYIFAELIQFVLAVIPVIIPDQVVTAITYLVEQTRFLGGVINFAGIFPAAIAYLNFLVLWYTFRAIMWGYHMLPHPIGKKDAFHFKK